MKKILPFLLGLLFATSVAVLPGCSVIVKGEPATLYDLGPLPANPAGALPALPPISVADVEAPAWLDSSSMFYRLQYANAHQPRPYAQAHWTMAPGQLLSQRVKARIVQAGGVALASTYGAVNVPVLRIDADDFVQHFEAPGQSNARVALRASVFTGRTLLAQRTFIQQAPAPTPNAAGGVQAMAVASDAAITDMIDWLGTLPLK